MIAAGQAQCRQAAAKPPTHAWAEQVSCDCSSASLLQVELVSAEPPSLTVKHADPDCRQCTAPSCCSTRSHAHRDAKAQAVGSAVQKLKAAACPESGQPEAALAGRDIHPQAAVKGVCAAHIVCCLVPLAALCISSSFERWRLTAAHECMLAAGALACWQALHATFCSIAGSACGQHLTVKGRAAMQGGGGLTATAKPVMPSMSKVQPCRELFGAKA